MSGFAKRGTAIGATVVVIALGCAWFAHCGIGRAVSYSLPVRVEEAAASSRIESIWANEDGTRVLAVGEGGVVLERRAALGDASATWRSVADGNGPHWRAVKGGIGPWRHGEWTMSYEGHTRVFVVGDAGALMDCTAAPCVRVDAGTGANLTGVGVAGGQGIVVGEQGIVLHLVPDAAHHSLEPPETVRIERVDGLGTSATLRAVVMDCAGELVSPTCLAVAVGDGGTILEGTGTGACDEGFGGKACDWRWRFAGAPVHEALLEVWKDARGLVAATREGRRLRRLADGTWAEEASVPGTWREVEGVIERREERWFGARVVLEPARIAYGDATRFRRPSEERWFEVAAPPLRQAAVASSIPEDVFVVLGDDALGVLRHAAEAPAKGE